jgi:hypothetical protein
MSILGDLRPEPKNFPPPAETRTERSRPEPVPKITPDLQQKLEQSLAELRQFEEQSRADLKQQLEKSIEELRQHMDRRLDRIEEYFSLAQRFTRLEQEMKQLKMQKAP